ncbi:Hypothetical protein FKW44_024152 [Caligus rogercresseyi]|uniref:Uncharacterized protein n=1 Tax=Caligus rogercresseyi TaxID=217165 RepID=A0A7T8GMW1_CALRO|nr:Hypothetical protein FKW44_024772 [Caligus rogercresseyi]QQP32952.1 Hypothetical protein FKW44_024152 [Caligus rogercresseyi]
MPLKVHLLVMHGRGALLQVGRSPMSISPTRRMMMVMRGCGRAIAAHCRGRGTPIGPIRTTIHNTLHTKSHFEYY